MKKSKMTAMLVLLLTASLRAFAPSDETDHAHSANPPFGITGNGSDRVVHRFDFDERPGGNLEDLPKDWTPLHGAGFPRFTHGTFADDAGHFAPPSFHLASSGRDVAYQYEGTDTPVFPDTEYRIEGYIRPDRLADARACLSAHYLDDHGRPLLDTLVRSRYLGGAAEPDGWARVELFLAPAPPNAATIGLIAWVLQESTWNTGSVRRRPISPVDVAGGAWFDDITIFRLPRVEIAASGPGNVIDPDGPKSLRILLADANGEGLSAKLMIFAADGRAVREQVLTTAAEDAGRPIQVSLESLPPGHYRAQLNVGEGESLVLSRELSFLLLPTDLRPRSERLAGSFGVVIDPRDRADRASELALLKLQSARSVKVPIWTGLDEEAPDYEHRRADERFLQDLVKNRFLLTGVLWGTPSGFTRGHDAYEQSLLDLLGGERGSWEGELAAEVAPTASLIRWWQLGPDEQSILDQPGRAGAAVEQLRSALRTYMTLPRLAAGVLASDDLAALGPPVEQLSLSIPSGFDAASLAGRIRELRGNGYETVSAHVAPLPAGQYERLPRLGEWARRLVAARHVGADVVFVPQLWRTRWVAHTSIVEPTEEYLILRTVAELLLDAAPGPVLQVGEGVHCLAFMLPTNVVLAIWDDGAPLEGRRFAMQLGRAERQIDLWGQSEPLSHDETGRQLVRVSPLPVFVEQVEPWLIDLMTSVSMDPPRVESGTELVRHALQIHYRGLPSLSGQGVLVPPDGVEVSPRSFAFTARSDQRQRIPFEVRYGHNEPAGRKEFVARIDLVEPPYTIEIPLSVELSLTGVEVSGSAVIERDALILQHVIRNRSSEVLYFRSTAAAPGRERQHRPITNLGPGETQTVEYRFHDGADLIGRRVHLALRELNDGPRQHNLELVVP